MESDVSTLISALAGVELPPEVERQRQDIINALAQRAGHNESTSESIIEQEDENLYDDTAPSSEADKEEPPCRPPKEVDTQDEIYDDTIPSCEANEEEVAPPPRPPKVEENNSDDIYDDTIPAELPEDGSGPQLSSDSLPNQEEQEEDDDPGNYEELPAGDEANQDQEYAITVNDQKDNNEGTGESCIDDDTYDIIALPGQPQMPAAPTVAQDEKDEDDEQVDYTLPVRISDIKGKIKEGWLWKHKKDGQFSLLSKFQKRYCVLVKHALYYYKNEKDKCQRGQIILPGYQIIYPPKQVPGTKKVDHCFELNGNDKRKFQVIQFMAANKDDALEWTKTIQNQLNANISKRKSVKLERMEIKSVEMDQDNSEAGSEKGSLCSNEDVGSNPGVAVNNTSSGDDDMYEPLPEENAPDEDFYEAIPGSQQIPSAPTLPPSLPSIPIPNIPPRPNKMPQDSVPPLPSNHTDPSRQVEEEAETQDDMYDDVDPSLKEKIIAGNENLQEKEDENTVSVPTVDEDFYDDVDTGKVDAFPPPEEHPDSQLEEGIQEELYDDVDTVKMAVNSVLTDQPSTQADEEVQEDFYDDVDTVRVEALAKQLPDTQAETEEFYDDVDTAKNGSVSSAEDHSNTKEEEVQEDFNDDVDSNIMQGEDFYDDTVAPTHQETGALPPRPPKGGGKRSIPEPEESPSQPLLKEDIKPDEVYVALWDCSADGEDELDFKRGDFIHILNKVSSDWWIGKTMSAEELCGLVPSLYLQEAYYL